MEGWREALLILCRKCRFTRDEVWSDQLKLVSHVHPQEPGATGSPEVHNDQLYSFVCLFVC